MFTRHLLSNLQAALADTPVVMVQGARQTGKSTLTKRVASGKPPRRYLTMDDPTILAAASTDAHGFIRALDGPVVLDEVQRAPALFMAIKAEVDRQRDPGRFLLTGSALRESAGKKTVRGIVLYDGTEAVPFDKDLAAVPLPAIWTL